MILRVKMEVSQQNKGKERVIKTPNKYTWQCESFDNRGEMNRE